jgi:hypothetical protein
VMGVIKDERREEREGGGSSSSVEYFSFREGACCIRVLYGMVQ